LLNTTPDIRKLDLEDACEITDSVLAALTPGARPATPTPSPPEPEPGHALEHLVISYAVNVTSEAVLVLMRGCTRLRVLEADNTHIMSSVLREFVRITRKRKIRDGKIVAVDCRGIGESVVRELAESIRPRQGWRSYGARKLKYLDGRDNEDLSVGQDECDERRVVLKSFYSWQTVDAVRAAREKRRKSSARRVVNESNATLTDEEDSSPRGTRWWTPGGRRGSGGNSPTVIDITNNDGCRIM